MPFFKSKHELWLEEQVKIDRERHDALVERLQSAHASELNRVIEENQKLRDELDRTRLFLNPALQHVQLNSEQDNSTPPSPEEIIPTGTPWQRIMAREIQAQKNAAATEEAKRRAAVGMIVVPKGETDGSLRQGREPASQPEQGKL